MRFVLELFGAEILTLDISVPRLGILSPGFIPDSVEAFETWAMTQEDDDE